LTASALTLALLLPVPAAAWDTLPHQRITRAALDSLPQAMRARIAPEFENIAEIYCMYPDRYAEMSEYGFVRRSPGPKTAEEIRRYCVRDDGEALHSASWDADEDMGSLLFLSERILQNLKDGRTEEAAKYIGVLAHFIEDSYSPPHSVSGVELERLAGGDAARVHGPLEREVPVFTLRLRVRRVPGKGILESIEAIRGRLHAGGAANRKQLPALIRAFDSGDKATLDAARLRTARAAAELFADTLFTLFTFAAQPAATKW
jgi:hypothetical protein